jgi:hypothetical protein
VATATSGIPSLERARRIGNFFDAEWDYNGSAAPALSALGSGRIYFDSGLNKYRVSENGGAFVDLVGGGAVGPGTVNRISKFTGATAVGDSSMFDNGTSVIQGGPTTTVDIAGVVEQFSIQRAAAGTLRELLHHSGGGTAEVMVSTTAFGGVNAGVRTLASGHVAFFAANVGGELRLHQDGSGHIVGIFSATEVQRASFNAGDLKFQFGESSAALPGVFTNFKFSPAAITRFRVENESSSSGAGVAIEWQARTNGTGDHLFKITQHYANADGFLDRAAVADSNRPFKFRSTNANATFWSWNDGTTELIRITKTGTMVPGADNTFDMGTDALRIKRGRFVTVVTGDLELKSDDGLAHWTIREAPDAVYFVNNRTGRRYRAVLEEAA